eukprot:TRINITY_DN869_c0_g2_i2.p1 TRINITY_DN869_c0_g2~~TRINITY_DN869_c0_g2_i2.p1  ORF type:complete len:191 (-),score=71.88 TRINITY_DN869_c0_g2_i2:300-872(-)
MVHCRWVMALCLVTVSMATESASVFSLNGADCDTVSDSIRDVCSLFGGESDACMSSRVAYHNQCESADLGESMQVSGLLDGLEVSKLKTKNKAQLVGIVQKLAMSYSIQKQSSQHMRDEIEVQRKNCAKTGAKAENSEKAALEREEKSIEGEKATNLKDKKGESPEKKAEVKEFKKELAKVEKGEKSGAK